MPDLVNVWPDGHLGQPTTGTDAIVGGTRVPVQHAIQIAADEPLTVRTRKPLFLHSEDNAARDQINED